MPSEPGMATVEPVLRRTEVPFLSVPGVYHSEPYLKAAEVADPDGQLFVWRSPTAMVPMVLRPLPRACGDGFDAITPYDFSGPQSGMEGLVEAWEGLSDWARRHDVVTAFYRFHPLLGNAELWRGLVGLTVISTAQNVVVELDPDVDPARDFKPTVIRDRKVARRAGVACDLVQPGEPEMAAFGRLYTATMRRVGAQAYYYFNSRFFEDLRTSLGSSLRVMVARRGERIVAAALILLDQERAYYYLSGFDDQDRSACVMNAVIHDAIHALRDLGIRRLHLGGGRSSLLAFKERFGPGRVPYFVGRAIFDEARYHRITGGRTTEFFPAYRESGHVVRSSPIGDGS